MCYFAIELYVYDVIWNTLRNGNCVAIKHVRENKSVLSFCISVHIKTGKGQNYHKNFREYHDKGTHIAIPPNCRGVHWSPLALRNGNWPVTSDLEVLSFFCLTHEQVDETVGFSAHQNDLYITIGKVNAGFSLLFKDNRRFYEKRHHLRGSHMCYEYLQAICLMRQVWHQIYLAINSTTERNSKCRQIAKCVLLYNIPSTL